MSRLRWCLAFLFSLLVGVDVLPASSPAALALTHVTVIDATGAAAKPDMTVVISGGRIAVIGKSATAHIPKAAQVIDAAGKYLIPALWDMHIHWGDRKYLPLFLANGVTGIRITWEGARQQDWRRQSEARLRLISNCYSGVITASFFGSLRRKSSPTPMC
jgi:cytosine/adenosine deaminase-related metal-dependent hydrolase